MSTDEFTRLYDRVDTMAAGVEHIRTNQEWVMKIVEDNGKLLSHMNLHGCAKGAQQDMRIDGLEKFRNGNGGAQKAPVIATPAIPAGEKSAWFEVDFLKRKIKANGWQAVTLLILLLGVAYLRWSRVSPAGVVMVDQDLKSFITKEVRHAVSGAQEHELRGTKE